ncbi:hypothetical protein PHYPSEUDO_010598 [Phytophthora pseudosyringae]|uniref:Protein FRA10AC1 n=1 Tax=Phytophthora pseudosyringae TaxID=221518 RepID=A0A8T1VCU8_9STRA|nr:hypothetical protein PHYPSEUDO_010598 [Phytophthora pseudosyringae]
MAPSACSAGKPRSAPLSSSSPSSLLSTHTCCAPRRPSTNEKIACVRSHQELMRLYSASTRRGNSVGSDRSSITPRTDLQLSQNDDLAVLKQKFQFIRDDEADAEQGETDWQVRMSVRYYRQLFREYALADLSRHEEGKIGLRWRTEMEVVAGKGQFSCGNKRCDERAGLHSYELLFSYVEHGERKRCLVKVRACAVCAEKLFYKKLMEVKRKKAHKQEKRERKRRRLGRSGGKQKAKRCRRSTSCSDEGGRSGSNEDVRETEGTNDDFDAGSGEGIHELCAKINAEQKAAYPAATSRGNARVKAPNERSGAFDELLP